MSFRQLGFFEQPATQINSFLKKLSLKTHPDKGGVEADFKILTELRKYVNNSMNLGILPLISETDFCKKHKIMQSDFIEFSIRVCGIPPPKPPTYRYNDQKHTFPTEKNLTIFIDLNSIYLTKKQNMYLTKNLYTFIRKQFSDIKFTISGKIFKIIYGSHPNVLRESVIHSKNPCVELIYSEQNWSLGTVRSYARKISNEFIVFVTNDIKFSNVICEAKITNNTCVLITNNYHMNCGIKFDIKSIFNGHFH